MSTAAPSAPVDAITGMTAARFGLYVHFPYCLSKCPYCDFASVAVREVPEERYARAVLWELELRLASVASPSREVQSIFLGGGTPSLWNAQQVERVLQGIAARLRVADHAEVTLEANPNAADASRFRDFRSAGVNRLSIGAQSFDSSILRALGREHDGLAAIRAFEAARRAGFENLSLDFIYGVHGQTLEQVESDARRAASLQPEHLSAYALTLDRAVLAEQVPLSRQLERGEIALPSDDETLAMTHAIREIYAHRGLLRYEISNYARPGFHSRHNALYWTGGEYLALGCGATGHLRTPDAFRYANHRSPERYLESVERQQLPEASREILGRRELFEERLGMGLRLLTGVDLEAVCEQFQQPFAARREEADRLVAGGFARRQDGRYLLTDSGADLHTEICARLI
jgi:oxygen-independent coproporphyrinogen-3 oxidase